MSTWAKLDIENLVIDAIELADDKKEPKKWLESRLGGKWIKVTKGIPAKGYKYDSTLKAFVPPKPFDSWTLNTETLIWTPPVENPQDGKIYDWDEENKKWVETNFKTD